MIRGFRNRGTEDIYNGLETKAARKACPPELWAVARRKLDMLEYAVELKDLRVPPGNRLEALRGRRKGQHSIRINDRYRLCFAWIENGAEAIEITDYH